MSPTTERIVPKRIKFREIWALEVKGLTQDEQILS